MKAADMRRVLLGETREVRERHPTPADARHARSVASTSLRALKDRDFHGSRPKHRASIERLNATCMYVDPADPCVVVCSADPKPYQPSRYDRVTRLAVGETCELRLPGTKLVSVLARLKAMAAEAEEAMGTRPTWRVEQQDPRHWADMFVVTRLPDDHDPLTGQPRAELTGRRKAEHRELWERINRLLSDYETGALYNALVESRPIPPIPEDLRILLAEHDPQELAALEQRVEEAGHAS